LELLQQGGTMTPMSEDELEMFSYDIIKTAKSKGHYIKTGDLSKILYKLTGSLPNSYFPIRFQKVGDEIESYDVSRAVASLLSSDQLEISHSHSEVYETTPFGELVHSRALNLLSEWLKKRGTTRDEVDKKLLEILMEYK